jgi:hypothetical protein
VVTGAEQLAAEEIVPGDRILVPSSGHSAPDTPAEVLEILRRRLFHVRLNGGRDVYYAADRAVQRLPRRR